MMKARYLFEFCDQHWVPKGARECLYEVMEACNSGARSFNGQVAERVLGLAREAGATQIVEMGAGRAPISAALTSGDAELNKIRVVPCDLVPNEAVFRQLAENHPGVVCPIYKPVDITEPQEELFRDSVLVLTGMMHHVPFDLRPAVLRSLSLSGSRMAMFEPLRRNLLSMMLAVLSFFPAILLPVTFFRRPGKLRRMLWCWLVPIVPIMFVWDGVVSCLRQWTEREWRTEFEKLGGLIEDLRVCTGVNSLTITWRGVGKGSADGQTIDSGQTELLSVE